MRMQSDTKSRKKITGETCDRQEEESKDIETKVKESYASLIPRNQDELHEQ